MVWRHPLRFHVLDRTRIAVKMELEDEAVCLEAAETRLAFLEPLLLPIEALAWTSIASLASGVRAEAGPSTAPTIGPTTPFFRSSTSGTLGGSNQAGPPGGVPGHPLPPVQFPPPSGCGMSSFSHCTTPRLRKPVLLRFLVSRRMSKFGGPPSVSQLLRRRAFSHCG